MADIAFDIIGRDRASAAFRSVGKSAKGADTSVSSFGTTLKSHIGKFAALTGASLGAGALIGFAKSAVDTEKAYSTSMRTIKVATGATGAQMDKLNKQAIDLGIKTVFSAGDAADAMLELGKAGQNAGQIMQTVPQVMNLAATEGMGLADAAGVVTSALAQFGLKARKSAVVVNALAGASNASKASVASMSEALNYGGAAAHAVGLTVQQTSGALAALAQHGQEGSVAGSALASVFNHLQPQTLKASNAMHDLGINFVNANGSFKSISQIAQILQSKLGGLSPAARKADISAIFGRNASSIAAVLALMNEGAKGINKYTKASSDMGAAARLSNARMGGTAGAIEQLNGSIDTAKLKLGQALAPMIIKVSNYLAQHLVPAMDDTISFTKDVGKALDSTLVPPLKIVGKLALDVAKFFGGLPGPLKSVGIEAGIAALVFPRLAAGVTGATTAIKDQITYARVLRLEMAEGVKTQGLMTAATSKLGGALTLLAGAGGMVAMTEGAKHSNDALSALGGGLSGAALGAMAGSAVFPGLGTAIGGIVGAGVGAGSALWKMGEAEDKVAKAGQPAAKSARDYATSLDQVSAKATQATRSVAFYNLQQEGALKSANRVGISSRDLVSATLGQKGALDRINGAIKTYVGNNALRLAAVRPIMSALGEEQRRLGKDTKSVLSQALAVGKLSQVLHGVPKRIRTKISQDGNAQQLTKDLVRYIRQGKLVPKQLRTIIRATGIDLTVKDLMGLAKTGKTTATQLGKSGKDGGAGYGKGVSGGISGSQGKVNNSMTSLLTTAKQGAAPKALTGGTGIGLNLSLGVGHGIINGTSFVNSEANQLIAGALAHMRAAAKTKSPSRKTMKIGNDIGDGLRIGMRQRNGGAKSAGVQLIESLVKGIDQHKVRVKDVLSKLTDYIDKQTSKISNLTSKRQGIIDSVKGFSSSVFGATFQDAEGNDRAGSVADLIAFQQKQAAQAAQLQADIKTLTSEHLSKSLIQQMLSEGASGIANIHTLAGASASDIATINAANSATQSSLTAGGNTASGALGVNSALAQAKRDKATAEALAVEFRKVLHEEKKDLHVYVELDGKQLHTVLVKERAKTKKPLGLG